jgi:hypothetical protein
MRYNICDAEMMVYMLIQPNMPVTPTRTTVVTIPAPALSAVVAGLYRVSISGKLVKIAGNTYVIAVGFVFVCDPALGLPALVPPVAFVTGGDIYSNGCKLTNIADMAAISCPTPVRPS